MVLKIFLRLSVAAKRQLLINPTRTALASSSAVGRIDGSVPLASCHVWPVRAAEGGGLSVRRLGSAQNEYRLEAAGLQVESFHARDMFLEAVNSVEPHQMVQSTLRFDKSSSSLSVCGKVFTVHHNVYVVGFGKAVLGMARALEDSLGPHIVSGILSIPRGQQQVLRDKGKEHLLLAADSKISVYEGAQGSYPDQAAFEAALAIEKFVSGKKPTDIIIVLVSGGGSALLPYPEPPISLEDLVTLTKLLTRVGATKVDMGIVRKNIEHLKGGKLIDTAQPAQLVSLIVSDMVNDSISKIASGPTVHDPVTAHQSFQILKRYNLLDKTPESVLTLLRNKMEDERHRVTLSSPGSLGTLAKDQAHSLRMSRELRAHSVQVGSNLIACQAAARRAQELGHLAYVLTMSVQKESRTMGAVLGKLGTFMAMCFDRQLASSVELSLLQLEVELVRAGISKTQVNHITHLVEEAASLGCNAAIICSGQTYLDLRILGGVGGRNCEIGLGAAIEFQRLFQNKAPRAQPAITLLSADTDGEDGPNCPAAGVIVNENLAIEAARDGHSCQQYLDNNNSYAFFNLMKGGSHLVITGMTETNVQDIQILIVRNPLRNIEQY